MQILNNPNTLKIYQHTQGNRWNVAEYHEAPRYAFNNTIHTFFLNKEDNTIILQIITEHGKDSSDSEMDCFCSENKETYQFDKTVLFRTLKSSSICHLIR